MKSEGQNSLLIFRRSVHSGGAEKAASRLADQFSSTFDDVRLLTEGAESKDVKIPLNKGPGWLRLIRYARSANAMISKTDRNSTISFSMERGVRAQIFRAGEGVHRAWIKRNGPARAIFSLRPLHPIAIWLEKRSFKSARYIVANSHMIADEIAHYYPSHRDKVKVIENGFDDTRFRVAPESGSTTFGDGEKRICFAGNGWERKGLDAAIRLFSQLPDDWSLSVLGRGNKSSYLQLAKRLGCESRITFEGEVSSIERFFQNSKAFILPTKYDPFSNACLEAAACGCLVITTKENGFSHLITHRQNGFILEGENDSECVDWLTENHSMTRASISAAVSNFTTQDETEKYLKIFEEILSTLGEGSSRTD